MTRDLIAFAKQAYKHTAGWNSLLDRPSAFFYDKGDEILTEIRATRKTFDDSFSRREQVVLSDLSVRLWYCEWGVNAKTTAAKAVYDRDATHTKADLNRRAWKQPEEEQLTVEVGDQPRDLGILTQRDGDWDDYRCTVDEFLRYCRGTEKAAQRRDIFQVAEYQRKAVELEEKLQSSLKYSKRRLVCAQEGYEASKRQARRQRDLAKRLQGTSGKAYPIRRRSGKFGTPEELIMDAQSIEATLAEQEVEISSLEDTVDFKQTIFLDIRTKRSITT